MERWREGFGGVILDSAQDLVPGGPCPFQPCVLLREDSGDPPRGTVQGQLGHWPGGAAPLLPPCNSISSLPAETNWGWGRVPTKRIIGRNALRKIFLLKYTGTLNNIRITSQEFWASGLENCAPRLDFLHVKMTLFVGGRALHKCCVWMWYLWDTALEFVVGLDLVTFFFSQEILKTHFAEG